MATQKENMPSEEVIDLRRLFINCWKKRMLFIKVWCITFIVACIYILPQPRTYLVEIVLAPEMGGSTSAGALSSIASSFGFNLNNANNSDAYYPELYPDLVSTNDFIVDLLYAKVHRQGEDTDSTYLHHILHYHRKNPYLYPLLWSMGKVKNLFEDSLTQPINSTTRMNPRCLTKNQNNVVNKVRNSIQCNVDIKTNVITLSVKDQDPYVCATLADSIRFKLQNFITEYRTNKSRIDEKYYRHLMDSARINYEQKLTAYSQFVDGHKNAVRQSYLSQRDRLENEVQTCLNTYNTLQTQYFAAKAKVQEQTPAFTMLKAPSVPVQATSPKRMFFVIAMLFLSTIVTFIYLYRKEIVKQFMGNTSE